MINIKSYKLKNGTTKWKYRLYLGISDSTGKKIDIHRQGFNSKAEALANSVHLKNEYEDKQIIVPAHSRKFRFSEIAELWFAQYKLTVKENTYYSAEQVYEKHIAAHFKDIFINKLSVYECQTVINEWYRTYAKASYLVSITSIIVKFAISLGYCNDNPFEKTIRPRNTKK